MKLESPAKGKYPDSYSLYTFLKNCCSLRFYVNFETLIQNVWSYVTYALLNVTIILLLKKKVFHFILLKVRSGEESISLMLVRWSVIVSCVLLTSVRETLEPGIASVVLSKLPLFVQKRALFCCQTSRLPTDEQYFFIFKMSTKGKNSHFNLKCGISTEEPIF